MSDASLDPVPLSEHEHFVLDTGSNDLYGYSNDVYIDSAGESGEHFIEGEVWIKVGDTRKQTVEERVGQQDGTSDPIPLDLLFEVNDVHFRDKDFHDFLEDQKDVYRLRKYIDGKDREWFSFSVGEDEGPLDPLIEYLQKYIGSEEGRASYSLRDPQEEARDKMMNAWEQDFDEFLLAGKMRFGKNFTVFTGINDWHEIKVTKFQTRVLFTSYKVNVFESVREQIAEHEKFTDFEVIDLRNNGEGDQLCYQRSLKNSNADVVVYVVSPQFLMAGKNYKVLEDEYFDFVIADEVHYGGNTEKFANHVIDANFDWGKLIWMTGTPFSFARKRSFTTQNSYYFTYTDEQELKERGVEGFQEMPKLQFNMMEVHESMVDLNDIFDEEEGFTLKKLFAVDDEGNLVYEDRVRDFLWQIKKGPRDYSPYGDPASNTEHTLWMLPKLVAVVNAVAELLKDMSIYNEKVWIAAGQKSDAADYDHNAADVVDSDEIGLIKKFTKNPNLHEDRGSITLTCGRFKEGTTVERWHSVFMLDDGESPENYFQTIFRGASPRVEDGKIKKHETHIYDFNPERYLEVIVSVTEQMSEICENGDKEQSEILGDWLDFASIIDHRENGWKNPDADDILREFYKEADHSERMSSAHIIEKNSLLKDEEDVAPVLANVDGEVRKLTGKPNGNGTEGGKNRENRGNNNGSNEESDDSEVTKKDLLRATQTVLARLPIYLLASEKNEESVNHILREGDKELFEDAVGITLEGFGEISEHLKKEDLNRRIQDYRQFKLTKQEERNELFDF